MRSFLFTTIIYGILISTILIGCNSKENIQPIKNESMTWNEIDKSKNLTYPSIFISVEGCNINIFNLCTDGKTIKEIKPSVVCFKRQRKYNPEYPHRRWNCVELGEKRHASPISYNVEHCVKWIGRLTGKRCLKTKIVRFTHSLEYDIPIYRRKIGRRRMPLEMSRRELFVKKYVIPNCK